MKRIPKHFTIIAILTVFISGCHVVPYRIDIDQGNVISESAIKTLKKGMSKQQVIALLGQPLIKDPFHENRWDYVHHTIDGKTQTATKQSVTLHFFNNSLSEIKIQPIK